MRHTECLLILLACFIEDVASKIDLGAMGNLQTMSDSLVARMDNTSVFNEALHGSGVLFDSLSWNGSYNGTDLMLNLVYKKNHNLLHSNFQDYRSVMISDILWQVLNSKTSECNFMVATMDSDQPLVAEIMRQSFASTVPIVMLDMNSKIQVPTENLLSDAWASPSLTCRTLLIDLTSDSDLQILRDLARQQLRLWPNANVLMVGAGEKAKPATQHPTLGNIIQPLYLGIEEKPTKNSLPMRRRFERWNFPSVNLQLWQRRLEDFKSTEEHEEVPLQSTKEQVRLYIRCLYCNHGQAKTIRVMSWLLGAKLPALGIPYRDDNFNGGLMRVVSIIAIKPYASYIQSEDGPGGVVTMLDSFDKRLLDALSARLNFSYEVRSPKKLDMGNKLQNGSWTGIMGTFYNNEADFTTILASSPDRTAVIDHKITMYVDQVIITSLKPQLLPQYLVFLRPFTVDVWILVLFSIAIWGALLWLLQRIRSSFSGSKWEPFHEDIFYSFALLLGNPIRQSTNITIQMLSAWWLIVSFLVTTIFKSSLVAHLTVEGKTRPIDTCSDLIKQYNWAWGIDMKIFHGVVPSFFKEHVNPDIRHIYEHLETLSTEEGLKKVLRGRYSFLSPKDLLLSVIGPKYTDRYGETPFYLGKEQYKVAPAFGWGFRKGAPFRTRFFKAISHIWESGISNRWLKEVQLLTRKKIGKESDGERDLIKRDEVNIITDDGQRRVIRTKHMLGVYLVLFVGLSVASVSFIGESFRVIFSYFYDYCPHFKNINNDL